MEQMVVWETIFFEGGYLAYFQGILVSFGEGMRDMSCATDCMSTAFFALKLLVLKMQLNCRVAVGFSFLL